MGAPQAADRRDVPPWTAAMRPFVVSRSFVSSSTASGRAKQVALTGVAAEAAQPVELDVGLDALGDHRHPSARPSPTIDDRDRRRVVGLPDRADEVAVDLERREREPLERRERRVAGAEVVQAERDADARELGDVVPDRPSVSSRRHPSVISIPRSPGPRPCRSSSRVRRWSTKSGCASWCGDTFDKRAHRERAGNSRRQTAIWRATSLQHVVAERARSGRCPRPAG